MNSEPVIAHIPYLPDENAELEDLRKENLALKEELQKLSSDVSNISRVTSECMTMPVNCADSKGFLCWWCCHDFDWPSVRLPHSLLCGTYYVFGNFCSFNCALAYNNSCSTDFEGPDREVLLYSLYAKVFPSLYQSPIIPAPPRETLSAFGGFLSIEDFRKSSTHLQTHVRVLTPPLRSLSFCVEKEVTAGIKKSGGFLPLKVEAVKKAKETLKLKREKPKKNNFISLEETMGLVVKKKP